MARRDRYKQNTKKKTDRFGWKELTIKHKILRIFKYAIILGILSVLVTVGYTAIKIGPINRDSLYSSIEQSSVLYDTNGEEIDTLHYTEDRQIVPVKDMPEDLKNAFIAIEDKTFYKHHGFNFRRMFGAVLSKLTGRSDSISGTSTITQQLARNAYLAEIKSQRSIYRKLSEMFIAWRLESKLSKDEILEAYLNTIYLGYGNYGVGAAARTYFSKETGELNLEESAALAALPQAPDSYALIVNEGEEKDRIKEISYYSLNDLDEEEEEINYVSVEDEEDEEGTEETEFYANDISKERRDLVLELMADQGYISDADVKSAEVDIIDILKPSFERSESAYTYFTDYVSTTVIQDLMEKYNMSEEEAQRMVYTGGLEIYTTVNSELQNTIFDEFKDDSNFPTAVDGSKVEASMVVTEVGTGRIAAMVGGRDASGSKLFNRAVSPRQPGSSIKPLAVYGAALQRSFDYESKNQTFPFVDYGFDNQGTKYWGDYITTSSGVVDEPLHINGEEWPKNDSRTYSGSNSFRTAIQKSINTCAVKILWQVGLDYSIDLLQKFGLSTLATDESEAVNDVNPAALGLGAMTHGVTPLEMSLAYAAFPGGGTVNTPVCYSQIKDSKGKVLMRSESKETKVLDEGVAWIMTDVLKSVVSNGLGRPASISGVQVGGKTGTTNDVFDVWFDGFTPDYAAALWIGTDLNVEMNGTSMQAARLWGKIMGQISGVRDGVYRDMPSNVVRQNGEYYTEGTEKNAGRGGGKAGGGKKRSNNSNDDKKSDSDGSSDSDSKNKEKPASSGGDSGSSSGGSSSGGNSGSSSGGNTGGDTSGGSGGGSGDTGGGSGDTGGGSGDTGGGSGGSDTGGGSGGSDTGGGSGSTDPGTGGNP